jgi:choline monooxygenase
VAHNDLRPPPLEEASALPARCYTDLAFFKLERERVFARSWQLMARVDEVVVGIAERIAPVDLSALRFHYRVVYEVACNWKVYVDNFLEGYHLPRVHPGLSKVLDYRSYATELASWHSLQHSPLRDAADVYGDGDAWYYFVFPNIMLNIMPGRLQTNVVIPDGLDRCRVVFDYYFSGEGAARSEADIAFSDEIQREDVAICELVQRGLLSGGYEPGRLSPQCESGVWHFQNLLRGAYSEE